MLQQPQLWRLQKLQLQRLRQLQLLRLRPLRLPRLPKGKDGQQQEEEKEHGLDVVKHFIHSLLYNLTKLLQSYTSIALPMVDQLQKLHQGVKFLSILLVEKRKRFNALDDEVKDLIGAVVIDAGILICSLSLDELKESLAKELDLALDELKEGLAKESDLAFSHLLRVLEFIMSEVVQIHPPTSCSPSSSSFSKTNKLGYFDFLSLLQHLKELVSIEADSIALLKNQFLTVKDDLESLKPFLKDMAEQRYQNSEFQTLRDSVMEVAHKVEFAIDSIIYQANDKPDCSPMSLGTITKEIKSLKIDVHRLTNADISDQIITKTSIHMPSRVSASAPKFNEVLVGLHAEQKEIINKLTRGSRGLDIVSIVGMAGLGKTTLADKVYNHLSITSHFYFRAWCTISREYTEHGLLLQIMGDVVSKNPDKYHQMKEDDLANELRKHLMRNRYLIVLDDVWQVNAFDLLQRSFPDNKNGSRLLITSQCHNLFPPFEDYKLRLLNNQESWELLRNKLFGGDGFCSPELDILGNQIARHCKGLPLAVVLMAGVLKNSEHNRWEDVANRSSSIGIKETLELSYQNLPDNLKPCLLYFGVFQEDQDIVVQSLLSLWISEGFVQYNEANSLEEEAKSLEDVAEEYLTNLIDRSLVMVTEQRSIGGFKICRIHDLLHEFCVEKAQTESFLQISHGWNELFASTTLYNPRRLSIHSKKMEEFEERSIFFPHLRSLLLFSNETFLFVYYLDLFENFKLLRVLNVRCEYAIYTFPKEIELLIHLRYLALPPMPKSIPAGIANLTRLETFLIKASITRLLPYDDGIKLPDTIWYMKKLRHLYYPGGFIFPTDNLVDAPDLTNLKTCTLRADYSSESLHHIIKKLPNIRRLKCVQARVKSIIENFQWLDDLKRLESLQMHGFLPPEFGFSSHLKKLTLAFCNKPWSEISAIGKLPNIEVLKLLRNSFVEETWEVREEKFPKLKFLKLESLGIRKWTFASSADDNFPCLKKLVLHDCQLLEDVPSCLGDIRTIEMIEVKNCGQHAIDSLNKIQEEQEEDGNECLQITIY